MVLRSRSGSARKIPLRTVLIVPFVIQLICVVGLVGYLSFRNGQRAVNDVAYKLRSEITARIREHLDVFLATPHRINQINARAIRQGLLDVNDPTAMEDYFQEQIQVFDSVTSIYFGNTAGGLVNAGREGVDDSRYIIVTDGFVEGAFNKYAVDAAGDRVALLATIPDFDARTRPWYTSAVEKADATWSDPYILFTEQGLAVAASRPVYDDRENLLGVVSIDIFTSHLSNFLRELKIGKTGQSFVIERSGLLIASSADEEVFSEPDGDAAQRRLAATESSDPMIRHAAAALLQQFGSYDAVTGEQQFEFEIEGARQFLQVSPMQDAYGIDWLVVVVIPESDFMAQIHANNRATALVILAALLIVAAVGVITERLITQSILRLNTSAQALAMGKWEQVNTVDWIDEISMVTRSFNSMAKQLKQTLEDLTAEIAQRKQVEAALKESNLRLEKTLTELEKMQEAMMQQERLAAVGQLAAGIAHDFNNIMASIVLYAQMTARVDDLPAVVRERMVAINQQAQHATKLIQQILDFSRRAVLDRQQLDLIPVLEEQIGLLRHTLPENIEIVLDHGADVYSIKADPTRIKQVITNLAINARDAMPDGGRLRFLLARVEVEPEAATSGSLVEPGPWVKIVASDTGQGIPSDVLPYIFEPFFTTKAPRGSGLGLAQVYGIVAQHGGHIDVESQVGAGTTFTLYFPALPVAEDLSLSAF